MIWHSSNVNDIIKNLNTDCEKGLTNDYVIKMHKTDGENIIKTKKSEPLLKTIISELKSFRNVITVVALIIVAFLNFLEYHFLNNYHYKVCFLVFVVLLISIAFRVSQNILSDKIIDLSSELSKNKIDVIRDSKHKKIKAKEIVVGDIITLKAGDLIPADCRIIKSSLLRCDEFAVSGEKSINEKNGECLLKEIAPLSKRCNMIYAGCFVKHGSVTAVVVETANKTELGKINILSKKEEKNKDLTSSQAQIKNMSDNLKPIFTLLYALIFSFGFIFHLSFFNMALSTISIFIVTNPKNLIAMSNFCLNLKTIKSLKNNLIIKNIKTSETLRKTDVIFVEKNANLTLNKFKAVGAWVNENGVCSLKENSLSNEHLNLFRLASICSNATLEVRNNQKIFVGETTEIAIVAAAEKLGFSKKELNAVFPRVCEIGFDNKRKLKTSVNLIDSNTVAIVKGYADVLLEKCTSGDISTAKSMTESFSKKGLTVVGVACKQLSECPTNPTCEELENNLTLIGLIAMIDPPQENLKDDILNLKNAGIKVVMSSDDNIFTSSNFARKNSILEKNEIAIDGDTLSNMDENEIDEQIEKISVCSNISQYDKLRLIKAWQKKGKTVSVIGESLEDLPLLEQADIGFSAQKNTSDMVKSYAGVIIKDNSFSSVVSALRENLGREESLKNVNRFLLCSIISKIILFIVLFVFKEIVPISATNIIILTLLGDFLPCLALILKKPEKQLSNIIKNSSGKVFNLSKIIIQSFILSSAVIASFILSKIYFDFDTNNIVFAVLLFSQILNTLNFTSNKSIFISKSTLNILPLLIIPIAMSVYVVYASIFATENLLIFALCFVPIIVEEIMKIVRKLRGGKKDVCEN